MNTVKVSVAPAVEPAATTTRGQRQTPT